MTALIVSEMLDWSGADDKYLALSKKNNSEWGPVLVRRGSADNIVVLDPASQSAVEAADVSLVSFLSAGHSEQAATRFHFGTRTGYAKRFRVVSLVPRTLSNVDVQLVIEDNRVFEADYPSLNYATPKNSAKWLFINGF